MIKCEQKSLERCCDNWSRKAVAPRKPDYRKPQIVSRKPYLFSRKID